MSAEAPPCITDFSILPSIQHLNDIGGDIPCILDKTQRCRPLLTGKAEDCVATYLYQEPTTLDPLVSEFETDVRQLVEARRSGVIAQEDALRRPALAVEDEAQNPPTFEEIGKRARYLASNNGRSNGHK